MGNDAVYKRWLFFINLHIGEETSKKSSDIFDVIDSRVFSGNDGRYLSAEAKRTGRSRFCIPFNRQELADYLSVKRSVMPAELSKLRDDGILRFHKNQSVSMIPLALMIRRTAIFSPQ